MAQIPTVTIQDPFKPGDFRIINESDFDSKAHKLWEEKPRVETGISTDSGDQFSDDQLRDAIEAKTGKKPHHKSSRETLIARFNELNAAG